MGDVIAEERRVVAERYDLQREIGRGGMGAVWLARDTVLGRAVALKRVGLMPGAQSPDLQRAEREARLAARLNHPHVVAVFDLVEDGDENWLVMEYVEGTTLSAFVKRNGALTPDEAAPLVRQAADALAAAHEAGVVHRDVKPSNMIVTPAGAVKLTDFGIARAEADASLTQTGLVTGSPAYLAPEVASGSTATEASDVWALGATLFHLLAGHPPYDVTENLMGSLYRIVHEDPPRLSNPGWLAPALEHTMTPKPEDRWSMAQVRDFLAQDDEVTIHPVPFGAFDEDGTRVMQPTPSDPVAVPPVRIDPHVAPAAVNGGRGRRSPWPWAVAAVALVAAAVIAATALTRPDGGPSSPSVTSTSHAAVATTSPSASEDGTDPATAMRSFIISYLSTVTSDQHTSWAMLTPAFQRASGGFGRYRDFWREYRSATPRDITPDPAGMTVSYAVDYVKTDGETSSDQVTLRLVKDGSSYLIDGES